jgi:hypothetical protein
MKSDHGRQRISFTVLLAGATFAVAVLSAFFLIYDSEPSLRPGLPLEFAAPQSFTEARNTGSPHTDHVRAKVQHVARIQHLHHPKRA